MSELADIQKKLTFTVITNRQITLQSCKNFLKSRISSATIYEAEDGLGSVVKLENAAPDVVLVDSSLKKISAYDLVEKLLKSKKLASTSIVIISAVPDDEHFVDEVVQGRVQFLADVDDLQTFARVIKRAVSDGQEAKPSKGYRLKLLGQGDILFSENDKAQCTYFVKKGVLQATKKNEAEDVVLGAIKFGEFVGEMAHFNTAPRSATVTAQTDCELIEIPFDALEMVLFSKPAWSRALIATLTRRLKAANTRMGSPES